MASELTAGHPDTGAYSADDKTAAGEINEVNRPSTNLAINIVIQFLALDNTHKENDGDDTQDRTLWQRMKEVVSLSDTPTAAVANPWGSVAIGTITEIQQLKTHGLFDLFTLAAQGNLTINLTNANFKSFLAGAQAAGVMSTTQETAFLELAKESRAAELGWPPVRHGDVTAARAL